MITARRDVSSVASVPLKVHWTMDGAVIMTMSARDGAIRLLAFRSYQMVRKPSFPINARVVMSYVASVPYKVDKMLGNAAVALKTVLITFVMKANVSLVHYHSDGEC